MPECLACHKGFPDYQSLAMHIQSSKKGHRRGKLWAAKILTNVRQLDQKVSNQNRNERTPLTESQKEAKRSTIREISGEYRRVLAVCPNPKCGRGHEESVEVEYLESETAWKSPSGKPMILCGHCRRN